MKRIYNNFDEAIFKGKINETIYIRPCFLEALNRLTFAETLKLYNFEMQRRNITLEVVPICYGNVENYEEAKLKNPSIANEKIFL